MSPKECPSCGASTRPVKGITLHQLLTDSACSSLDKTQSYRFCKSTDCEIVYFSSDGASLLKAEDLRVEVFQKSTDPERRVCYCFDHRVGELQAEVARSGGSQVPETIAEKCRQKLDRCEETNPQGACCLANVRGVVVAAQAKLPPVRLSSESTEEAPSCCSSPPSEPKSLR